MRDSVPSPRYSAVCNVLRQWNTSLIPTYTVYRLYDKFTLDITVALLCNLPFVTSGKTVSQTPVFVVRSIIKIEINQ